MDTDFESVGEIDDADEAYTQTQDVSNNVNRPLGPKRKWVEEFSEDVVLSEDAGTTRPIPAARLSRTSPVLKKKAIKSAAKGKKRA